MAGPIFGWWWIVPAAVAIVGVLTLFAGLGSLFKGRVFGSLFGTVGGATLMGLALGAALRRVLRATSEMLSVHGTYSRTPSLITPSK